MTVVGLKPNMGNGWTPEEDCIDALQRAPQQIAAQHEPPKGADLLV